MIKTFILFPQSERNLGFFGWFLVDKKCAFHPPLLALFEQPKKSLCILSSSSSFSLEILYEK